MVESKKKTHSWSSMEPHIEQNNKTVETAIQDKMNNPTTHVHPINVTYPGADDTVYSTTRLSQGYLGSVEGSSSHRGVPSQDVGTKPPRKRILRTLKSQENQLQGNHIDCSAFGSSVHLTQVAEVARVPYTHMQAHMVAVHSDGTQKGMLKRAAPKEKCVSDMMAKLNITDRGSRRIGNSVTCSSRNLLPHPNKRTCQVDNDPSLTDDALHATLINKWNHLSFEETVSLFEQDQDGDNLLMVSIIQGYVSLAVLLIKLVSSPTLLNLKNDIFQTALHMAVLSKNSHLVRELVIHGADITAQDRNGNTGLHIACKNNDLSSIIALTTVITPLDREQCSYQVTQKQPQPHSIYNYRGQTCLHIAAESRYFNVVRFLVESDFKADINAPDGLSGRTVLHLAAESGNKHLVKYLLKRKGLNLHQVTYASDSALDLAVGSSQKNVVPLLVRAGACLSHQPTDSCSEEDDENELQVDDFVVSITDSRSMERSIQSLADDMEYDDLCVSGICISDSITSLS